MILSSSIKNKENKKELTIIIVDCLNNNLNAAKYQKINGTYQKNIKSTFKTVIFKWKLSTCKISCHCFSENKEKQYQ